MYLEDLVLLLQIDLRVVIRVDRLTRTDQGPGPVHPKVDQGLVLRKIDLDLEHLKIDLGLGHRICRLMQVLMSHLLLQKLGRKEKERVEKRELKDKNLRIQTASKTSQVLILTSHHLFVS